MNKASVVCSILWNGDDDENYNTTKNVMPSTAIETIPTTTTTRLCDDSDDHDVAPTTVCFYLKKNIFYDLHASLSQQKRLNLCV